MASPTFFNSFKQNLMNGTIDLDTDVLKIYLTNTAPVVTNTVKADIAGITVQNGYTEYTITGTLESDGGTGYRIKNNEDVTWTAAGGSFGPFRYVVVYDDTPTSPADPLIMWWDVGSPVTISDTNTFTIDLDANFELFTLDS